jgi:hypothetical protein
MRPTIPLGPWRLAIDLERSRALNALETLPARGCECSACRLWADVGVDQLPDRFAEELRRVGIVPEEPSELYVVEGDTGPTGLRVTFHSVGRVLGGPAIMRESTAGDAGRHFASLPEAPNLTLAVCSQAIIGVPPPWVPSAMQPLLVVDMFIPLPRLDRADRDRNR